MHNLELNYKLALVKKNNKNCTSYELSKCVHTFWDKKCTYAHCLYIFLLKNTISIKNQSKHI